MANFKQVILQALGAGVNIALETGGNLASIFTQISSGGGAKINADGNSSTIISGHKDIATAGTAEALVGASVNVVSVEIQAKSGNTGLIYVGDSGVDNTEGVELNPGDVFSISIPSGTVLDAATIYCDTSVNGDGVTFVYVGV